MRPGVDRATRLDEGQDGPSWPRMSENTLRKAFRSSATVTIALAIALVAIVGVASRVPTRPPPTTRVAPTRSRGSLGIGLRLRRGGLDRGQDQRTVWVSPHDGAYNHNGFRTVFTGHGDGTSRKKSFPTNAPATVLQLRPRCVCHALTTPQQPRIKKQA